MPQKVERLFWRFKGGTRIGAATTSASNSYTDITNAGYLTMSGCARAIKTIFVRPQDFNVQIANASGVGASGLLGACNAGSMFASCALFNFGASAFPISSAASALEVPALAMGAGASPASPLWSSVVISKPPDADTTGSLVVHVDWTYGDAPLQSGCKKSFTVGAGYLDGLASVPTGLRTAASTGAASVGSYVGTTCGVVQSTCLGVLPSFGASDSAIVFVARLGASVATQDGTLMTGCTFILGYRIKYLSKSLGDQSTE